jgi:hypothetical protein
MVGKKAACMVCGKEKKGTDVQEDHVIAAMRWFKENVTHNAKGYRIVVCSDCMPEYRKLRAKFTRRRVLYVGLGVVFTVTIAAVSGGRYLGVLAYGVGITLFLYLLSLVSYVPALKVDSPKAGGPKSRR